MASVTLNGRTSANFPISRGTRQGCPLSPLIFALAMEPLTEALRSDPDFTGIPIRDKLFKLSLFADNMALYILNPHKSIPAIERASDSFYIVSGLKVNRTKSLLYPLYMSNNDRTSLEGKYPYAWVTNCWRYLGVKILVQFGSLETINLSELNESVQGLLKS